MFATVLCYVGVQRGEGQVRKKTYHTNAFCVKMSMMRSSAFVQEVRPKSGNRHGSMTQKLIIHASSTVDVLQVHGTRARIHHGWAGGGVAVVFACDIVAHVFNASQLHFFPLAPAFAHMLVCTTEAVGVG